MSPCLPNVDLITVVAWYFVDHPFVFQWGSSQSDKSYITDLYGRSTFLLTRRLQITGTKIAKIRNHITFTTRCYKLGLVPCGLRLKTPCRSAEARSITRDAEIKLMKATMNDLFRRQRILTQQENEIKQKLRAILIQQDYETISTLTDKYTSRVYTRTKERQINKFQKLHAEHARREGKPPSTNDAHSRCVVNLSKRNLDDNEQQVLSLGLNFAVPPRETPKLDIIAEVEKGLTRVQDTLTADRIRLEVSQALRCVNKKSRSNLDKPKQAALGRLRRDETIIILPADKEW